MDVPTLILLGAAGGLLRGALDLYTRFVSWQADRRAHRQLIAAGTEQGEAPQFQAYFDPTVDIVAAVVHSVMGAGVAVLLGTTGQISGEYAALVVGISAPMLLAQLGRIQTVNEVVTGDQQPEAGGPPAADAVSVAGEDSPGTLEAPRAAAAVAPSSPPPRVPRPAAPYASAPVPIQHPASAERPQRPTRPMPSPRRANPSPPSAVVPRTPEPAPGGFPDRTPTPDATRSADTALPSADPADGTGGFDGPGAPRWQGPAIGEEGR